MTLTLSRPRVENGRMTMEELEALDRAYRAQLRENAIATLRRAIDISHERHARTDCLEHRLNELLNQ
jgi:hypothetical protein